MNGTWWAVVIGMFAATYVSRASFIVFGQRLRFPPAVAQALAHAPVAVLTALAVPGAIAPGGEVDLSPGNPYLVGSIVTGLIAWKTGRLLPSVIAGFAVFGAIRWLA
jgi:branched-subunit amino acid transport protein